MALYHLLCLMMVTLCTLKTHYYQPWKKKHFKTISWTSRNIYKCLQIYKKIKIPTDTSRLPNSQKYCDFLTSVKHRKIHSDKIVTLDWQC